MKEYIAYKEHDPEGDIWSERAFLFETREDVKNFFTENNPDLSHLYSHQVLYDPITDLEISDDNPAGHITQVTFKTQCSGKVVIVEMHDGYLIPSNYK